MALISVIFTLPACGSAKSFRLDRKAPAGKAMARRIRSRRVQVGGCWIPGGWDMGPFVPRDKMGAQPAYSNSNATVARHSNRGRVVKPRGRGFIRLRTKA